MNTVKMNALRDSIYAQIENECIGNELPDGPHSFYIDIDKHHSDAYESLKSESEPITIKDIIVDAFSEHSKHWGAEFEYINVSFDEYMDTDDECLARLAFTVEFELVDSDDEDDEDDEDDWDNVKCWYCNSRGCDSKNEKGAYYHAECE